MRLTLQHINGLKVLLHLAGFLPLLWLILSVDQGWFSADPAKDIQHFTGRMALKLLLATLLVTPLARYGKQPLLIRCRRLLGLWCFLGDVTSGELCAAGAGSGSSGAAGKRTDIPAVSNVGNHKLADFAGAGGDLTTDNDAQVGIAMAKTA